MGFLSSIGDAISGAVGLFTGGDLIDAVTGVASFAGGSQTNEANKNMTAAQMDFQERMSSTAYQRAIADMKKAGLNPALAYTQGGASSPSGSSSTIHDAITPALSSARSSASVRSTLQQQSIQNQNIQSQTATNVSQSQLNKTLSLKALADAKLAATSARSIGADADYKNAGKGFFGRLGLSIEDSSAKAVHSASSRSAPTINDLQRVIKENK